MSTVSVSQNRIPEYQSINQSFLQSINTGFFYACTTKLKGFDINKSLNAVFYFSFETEIFSIKMSPDAWINDSQCERDQKNMVDVSFYSVILGHVATCGRALRWNKIITKLM